MNANTGMAPAQMGPISEKSVEARLPNVELAGDDDLYSLMDISESCRNLNVNAEPDSCVALLDIEGSQGPRTLAPERRIP